MMEKQNLWKAIKKAPIIVICCIAVVLLAVLIPIIISSSKKSTPEIISQANLERIINVNDLSTIEAIYNGVARVADEDNPAEIDYYVSYDAKVKAGIDVTQINIDVDSEKQLIKITLPETEITSVAVEIESLDYIFMDDSANTDKVSSEAYKKCIEDVTNKASTAEAIKDIATENAKNFIRALINPFIDQLDTAYTLVVE